MLDKNLIGIEPDFSKNSNYNPNANVAQVKFGADAPVLEVELNELQQVQDKAREDLIRSMIPSGFTKPVEINHYHDKTSSNIMVVGNDAEAYVNGIRICIPKGTRIELGDSPEKETREDLVFLEVWKEEVNSKTSLKKYGGDSQETIPNNLVDPRVGEETSHRVINRWRIRCAHGVNFKANPDGLRQAGTSFDDANVFAQGGREKPITKEDSIELFTCLFSQTNTDSVDNSVRNWNYKDTGLYIAGKGNESKDILKTFDGYSLAIPMFRLHRRPNQGFSTGDYANISPLADPTKLANLLQNEKLSSVATGEVECVVAGATMYNLVTGAPSLAVQHSDKITGKVNGDSVTIKRAVAGDSGFIYVGVPINLSSLEFNTDYTVVFNASGKAECEDAYLNIMTGASQEDVAGAKFTRKVGLNVVHVKTYKNPKNLTGQILYIGVNSYSGRDTLPNLQDEMTLGNFMLLKGKIEEKDIPKYFKGFKSVGDYSVKLDRFVSWGAEVVNGTAQDNIATIPVKLTNPYVRVVPVNLNGEEIVDANVAFKLLGTSDRELGWNSCLNTMYISNYSEAKQVRVFCNSIAKSNKINGFNIYTGNNIIIKSVIDDKNESVMEMQLNEPLRGIPNSDVRDLAFGDGRVVRKVARGVLDGSNYWSEFVLTSQDNNYLIFQLALSKIARTKLLSEFNYFDVKSDDDARRANKEFLGIYKGWNNNSEWLYLSIAKTKLSSQNTEGLKAYLREHPIEYYYQPKETYVENSIFNNLENFDDFNGNITNNLETQTKLNELDWTIGTTAGGWAEYDDTLVFYTTNFEDKMQVTRNLFCDGISYVSNLANENTLGICNVVWGGKSHPSFRVRKSLLSSPDIVGFKNWLKTNGLRLVYEAINPKITKYNMDYAKVKGNLLFTNDSTAKIECDSLIQPKVTLSHKAELNLDLFAEKCYVSTNSIIPPSTLEVNGQTSSTGNLELDLASDIKKAPVKILGRTLKNLYKIGKVSAKSDYLLVDTLVEDEPKDKVVYVVNNTNRIVLLNIYKIGGGWDSNPIIRENSITKLDLTGKRLTGFLGMYDRGWENNEVDKDTLKNTCIILEQEQNFMPTEYFQGLKSFGEVGQEGDKYKISILSHSKNFFKNYKSKSKGNTSIFNIENDNVTIGTNQSPSWTNASINYGKLKIGSKYTVSCESFTGGVGDKVLFAVKKYRGRDEVGAYGDITKSSLSLTFTVVDDADIVLRFFVNNATPINTPTSITYNNIQIIEGVKTDYAPSIIDKKDILIQEPLQEGDILYEDNRQVKIYRGAKQYTFTGDESSWELQSINSYNIANFKINIKQIQSGGFSICNMFEEQKNSPIATTKTEGYAIGGANDSLFIRINSNKASTLEDFKALLKQWKIEGNPLKIVYQLATPVTEVIKSVFNSNVHDKADFKGQVGYKRTSESGIDCGVLTLSPSNVNTSWNTGDIRLCDYSYSYGNIQDLVGIPLRLGAGYAYSTEHNFKILEVLSDTKVIVQNVGRNLPANLSRSFFPSFVCSTAQSEFTTEDLQKTVSLTGTDYTNLLEKLVCKHLY